MRLSRVYLWLIAATVVGAILLVLNEQFGVVFFRYTWVLVGMLAMTLAYGLVGLGCAAAYENGKAPRLMRSGMLVGAIALACAAIIVMTPELQQTPGPRNVLIWLVAWACLMSIGGLLLLLPMQSGWRRRLRGCTLLLLGVFAWFIACAVSFYPDPNGYWDDRARELAMRYEEGAQRIGAALGLVTSAALAITVVIGLTSAMSGERTVPQQSARRSPYWLQCPRCGFEQEAMTGDHHCSNCRLRTRIEIA